MAIAHRTCNQAIRPVSAQLGPRGWMVGGCSLDDLAEVHGTPLYVIDAATVEAACSAFLTGLKEAYPGPSEVFFASKALCNLGINRFIHEQGLGTEVVSGGELATALAAGIPPERIAFQGNAKSPHEIDEGLLAGVGRFMVDNLAELELLATRAAEFDQRVRVLLRLNPGVEAHTHEYIQTGHEASKFGIRPGPALEAAIARLTATPALQFQGLQLHIGSQIFDVAPFLDAARIVLDVAQDLQARGLAVREIDLGGGLGVAHVEGDDPPAITTLTAAVAQAVATGARERGLPLPTLLLEPGRAIVATAGCTVYEVVATKAAAGRDYLLVDGGMADNPRPITYGARYSCDPVKERPMGGPEHLQTLAGKACEEGDVLIRDAMLPSVARGERMVVWTTGAYCFSMASNYNRQPRPAMVLVRDGQAEVVRERESYADLIALDRLPARFNSAETRRPSL